ncbi:MAG: RNA polymerase sigma factor [Patescibacteria group bacterium]|nr:RNA polymerase sigma factor [Patescibacteria group bacterium]
MDDFATRSDEELLELSLKKPGMFEFLIARYQGQFLSRAQGIVRSRDAAEDVVQETFIRIYRFAPRFDAKAGNFRAWSLTILMNVARTHYRKASRDRGEVALLDPEHYESLADLSVTGEADAAYAKEVVEKALPQVSEDVRAILSLAYLEDLPYKEIAERLEISVPAVKTRVHRAKAELRKVIGAIEYKQ